jgi:hypothetical protein
LPFNSRGSRRSIARAYARQSPNRLYEWMIMDDGPSLPASGTTLAHVGIRVHAVPAEAEPDAATE